MFNSSLVLWDGGMAILPNYLKYGGGASVSPILISSNNDDLKGIVRMLSYHRSGQNNKRNG